MPYCGEQTLTAEQGEKRLARSLLCRSWRCETCNPVRHKGLVAQAMAGAPHLFITITRRRTEGLTPTEAAQQLVIAWRQFRRVEMKRRGLSDIPFIAIFEQHQSGWPHLHILVRLNWIDAEVLSAFMRTTIDSPIVDVRVIDSQAKIAGYVAKYVGKAPGQFGTLKRYWASRKYDIRPEDQKRKKNIDAGHWDRITCCIITWAERMEETGWRVQWTALRAATAEKPP